jgi:hypothetical protein
MAQLAEIQARINVALKDIISFYEDAKCPASSLENLQGLLDSHDYMRFLELAEGFSQCMAFIDHNLIVSKMHAAWNLVHDSIVIERKMVSKRLRPLEEDKKADPELVAKLQNIKANHDRRKAKASISCAKFGFMMKIPIQEFLKDPNFNPDTRRLFKKNK